jgi:two-component system cell cycle sensor histidine kinase/response regulator CckA
LARIIWATAQRGRRRWWTSPGTALRSLIARGLRSRGYGVIEATNGVEALEALEQRNGAVDLVVSDVVMPEMDGPTLLKAIRGRNSEFNLFISGYANAFEESLPENTQFAFLPKPFTLGQLIAAERERTSRKWISAGGTRR